ncbi:MAG: hypothetical protein ACLTYN_09590 [Dysosmobacter welbionis]
MEDAKRQTLARIVRAGAEEMLPASWRCWNRSAPSTAAPAMRRATPP